MRNTVIIAFLFSIAAALTPGFYPAQLQGADWPIYKGNIYFTGNNDEIIVKNNNLKWLFQADDQVFNPVVSDGRVYFVDRSATVYCIDEEYGKLIWKVRMQDISRQFKALSRAAGKVKYPLIKGDTLFLTDPIAIYAFNKRTGKVLWARTAMREEQTGRQGLSGYKPLPMVDGIYSDPVISGEIILYGTRNMFLSRDINNGHLQWDNELIKSFSGFPTFYDDLIFAQSMDYSSGRYTVHCLDVKTGKQVWSRDLPKPFAIIPPVVYKQKVYIPCTMSMYCLDIRDGRTIWMKDYGDYITSNPSFTDRAILFAIGNSDVAVIDPETGNINERIVVSPRSGPLFVTVRDQIYIARNQAKTVNGKDMTYGLLQASNFVSKEAIWEYTTPFPGAVSQPVASGGIMFLPAGNYLYALGTEYYTKIVDGGSGFATLTDDKNKKKDDVAPPQRIYDKKDQDKIESLRDLTVNVRDKTGKNITATVEIKKRDKGRIVHHSKETVRGSGDIKVPGGDNIELVITAPGFVPKKAIVSNQDKEKVIELDELQQDRPVVVDNILFEVDRAYLKKESLDILDKLITLLKENKNLDVEVQGHTDSTGDSDYNQKLSERRADSVVEYMIKNGISPERVDSTGFGEKKPIAPNNTEEGRSRNRRTEFFFKRVKKAAP
ncbi:MAG: hypothetical protein CVV44_15885 [Spirochaetae bacterium HGW-Spirochaetae-1]|jgi:outer membrane protein OmpA-like peptidoglycan-associated protein/outer membrane protein assembly factor BamB|nr:MAG: hypothetical protein CVV44_15885 [Spirochaetae bacterium HGW-Spirochaetae-1]